MHNKLIRRTRKLDITAVDQNIRSRITALATRLTTVLKRYLQTATHPIVAVTNRCCCRCHCRPWLICHRCLPWHLRQCLIARPHRWQRHRPAAATSAAQRPQPGPVHRPSGCLRLMMHLLGLLMSQLPGCRQPCWRPALALPVLHLDLQPCLHLQQRLCRQSCPAKLALRHLAAPPAPLQMRPPFLPRVPHGRCSAKPLLPAPLANSFPS